MRSTSWGRAAAALASCLPALALATVVLAESVEQLAGASSAVVRGRVGAQQVSWDESHAAIVTLTEIVTLERVKGETPSTFLVAQPGGTIDGKTMTVAGAAKFTSGEEVILFLQESKDPGMFFTRSLSAGKFTVNRQLTPVAVERHPEGLAFYAPGAAEIRPVEKRDAFGSLESFLERVRSAAGVSR